MITKEDALERQLNAIVGREVVNVSVTTTNDLLSMYRAGILNCSDVSSPYSDSFILSGILVRDNIPVFTIKALGSVLTVVQGAEMLTALYNFICNNLMLTGLSFEYACLNGCCFDDLPEKYQRKLLYSSVILKEVKED